MYELFTPAARANPHPIYARMRAEGRIHRIVDPFRKIPLWIVTRYDDCAAALKDGRLHKDARKLDPDVRRRYFVLGERASFLSRHMLSSDPPDHTRLRQLVQKAFSAKMIEGLRPRIRAIAEELLDRQRGSDHMDLIADYAFPLPITVIAELLGIAKEDRDQFRHWTKSIIMTSARPERAKEAQVAVMELASYFQAVFEDRRKAPREDLVSALTLAEEEGDKLSPEELLSMMFLLLVAGHETTVNLIGNGVLELLENPEQKERLVSNPGLAGSAVEEMLRYQSPVELSSFRWPSEDIEIAGAHVPAGEAVVAGLLSANRDEKYFEDPDRFDIGRQPNRHMAFGHGIHFCLGAQLARMEAVIAIPLLLERMPGLRLAVSRGELEWSEHILLRGMKAMPVAF